MAATCDRKMNGFIEELIGIIKEYDAFVTYVDDERLILPDRNRFIIGFNLYLSSRVPWITQVGNGTKNIKQSIRTFLYTYNSDISRVFLQDIKLNTNYNHIDDSVSYLVSFYVSHSPPAMKEDVIIDFIDRLFEK